MRRLLGVLHDIGTVARCSTYAIKSRAARPKDLAALPYLESTIAELERTPGD